jgi:hypothetical protein
MARKPRKDVPRPSVRSAAQREWNVAVGMASKLWDNLGEPQRLAWTARAKTRRSSGQRYCTGVNAPRFRDRQEPLTEPPAPPTYSGKNILRRLVIRNQGGRITLKLEVSHVPGVRVTVWGSRPYKPGISVGIRCPRLGELPAPEGGVSDITWLYFGKHWEYIEKHGVELVGKRIFIQVRVELEGWGALYEPASALVPPPEVRGGAAKKG